nr:protein FANTASTIC FOUR 3-like [Lolium perenne]
MTNSTLDSPPQLPAAGAWGSLFTVQKPAKSPNMSAVPSSFVKTKPAYGVKRNLAMCTEALGCETGGIDTTSYDADEGAARKRHAREEAEEAKVEPMVERKVRALPPPLTTLAAGASRTRMVHERRNGRLEVYAVRASGMEADRSGGRLRLRFHPCDGCNAAVCSSRQEPQEAEEDEAEEVDQLPETEYVVARYARRGRCLKVKSGATAFRVAIT